MMEEDWEKDVQRLMSQLPPSSQLWEMNFRLPVSDMVHNGRS